MNTNEPTFHNHTTHDTKFSFSYVFDANQVYFIISSYLSP
jgi:hypothetical protein